MCIVYVCVCKRARYKEGGMVGAHEVSRYYGDIPLSLGVGLWYQLVHP